MFPPLVVGSNAICRQNCVYWHLHGAKIIFLEASTTVAASQPAHLRGSRRYLLPGAQGCDIPAFCRQRDPSHCNGRLQCCAAHGRHGTRLLRLLWLSSHQFLCCLKPVGRLFLEEEREGRKREESIRDGGGRTMKKKIRNRKKEKERYTAGITHHTQYMQAN